MAKWYSAGGLLLMWIPKGNRYILSSTEALIHDGSTGSYGDTGKVLDDLERTKKIEEDTKQFILSPEKLLNILYWIDRNHHILSISDALLSNLVTNSFEEDPSGIDSIRILPDGSITPSTYLIEKNFIVGNILEKEVMKRLTKEMPMRAIIFDCIPEECKHCKYVQLCNGVV